MTTEHPLVHVVDNAASALGGEAGDQPPDAGPVLVVALSGFLDSGNAGPLAVDHLVADEGGRVVASFEVDELYDYRARRPPMVFREDHYEGYQAPRLVVRALRDQRGTAYLLLHGPEPDVRWEGFCEAVRHVVERLRVRLTLSWGSVPMAVPHTRPVMVTNHATRPELLTQQNIWSGAIQIPSSAASLLQLRLGEWGHDGLGFVAHVPHYVAQVDLPGAAIALLEHTGAVTGLQWDLGPLYRDAADRVAEIDEQVAGSDEVRTLVAGLEQQYDAMQRGSEGGLPLAEQRDLPTAEELGAEFEQFLAGLDPGEDGSAGLG